MKKTFNVKVEGKNTDRLLDAIKYEVRKYVKREKRKPLPEKADFWDLKCKFALNEDEPKVIEFVDITSCIDSAKEEDATTLYMEIIATKGYKPVVEKKIKEKVEDSEEDESGETE